MRRVSQSRSWLRRPVLAPTELSVTGAVADVPRFCSGALIASFRGVNFRTQRNLDKCQGTYVALWIRILLIRHDFRSNSQRKFTCGYETKHKVCDMPCLPL